MRAADADATEICGEINAVFDTDSVEGTMKDETSGIANEVVDVGLPPLLRECGARLDEDGSFGADALMEMRL